MVKYNAAVCAAVGAPVKPAIPLKVVPTSPNV